VLCPASPLDPVCAEPVVFGAGRTLGKERRHAPTRGRPAGLGRIVIRAGESPDSALLFGNHPTWCGWDESIACIRVTVEGSTSEIIDLTLSAACECVGDQFASLRNSVRMESLHPQEACAGDGIGRHWPLSSR
jgi:hypothetical protein